MDNCNTYWKSCVNWLVRCAVLRPDHQAFQSGAHIEDLAYTLRDGVLLCNLVNALVPDCIDMLSLNLHPQATKFLCVQNIKMFLKICHDIFFMKEHDLFEPSMLFDLTGFYQVLLTLSILSKTPKALLQTSPGFDVPLTGSSESITKLQIREVDYRLSLELCENASVSRHREAIRQDAIYEKIVRQEIANHSTQKKEKRDFIIEEIIVNEKSYLQGVLKTVLELYMKPLKTLLNPHDAKAIFGDIEKLAVLHEDFYEYLLKSSFPQNGVMLSEVFLKFYHQFLIYGEYCANLPRAQELLKVISNKDFVVKEMLNRCQAQLKNGRFYLTDLLVVPMQHILKYRLLLERLCKETSIEHVEKDSLRKAYDAMVDVNNYVNDVKRDREALQTIEKIESRISDLHMPGNLTIKDFGRLHKDDDLRIKFSDQKVGNRYAFIFDKVMLICKTLKDGTYACQEVLYLSLFQIKDMQMNSRWGHHWKLVHKSHNVEYVIHARNEEHKCAWMQTIMVALDNIQPPAAKDNGHNFSMCSFEKPTMCHICGKSLKGLIMQGYSCYYCKLIVHKICIKEVGSCSETIPISKQQTELPPPPYSDITNWNDYRFLGQYPWFAGVLHRKDADQILQVKKRGTFMLRIRPKQHCNPEESTKTEYAISLKTKTVVSHMLVFKRVSHGIKQFYLSEARYFPTIVELVDFYKHWTLQENYDELDEVLILPFKINSNSEFSSGVFHSTDEEAGENIDYLDMDQHQENVEEQCDRYFSSLSNKSDCQNQEFSNDNVEDRIDIQGNDRNMQYENIVIQCPKKTRHGSFEHESEDDSDVLTQKYQYYENIQITSQVNSLTSIDENSNTTEQQQQQQQQHHQQQQQQQQQKQQQCSHVFLSDSFTQTENVIDLDTNAHDIEKFGQYIVAALKLFKKPQTIQELSNEIRKIINERLDSEC